MVAIVAFATLAIVVLALPRRSALIPVPPADDSRSETSDSSAQQIVAAPSAASAVAPTAATIAKPVEALHSEGASMKKTSGEPLPNLVASASRRPAALSPMGGTHEQKLAESPHGTAAPTTTTVTAPAPPPLTTETDARAQVTITGCLEASAKDRFRLTDTEGANAPKARSWRSGFLKRRSAPVDLVGAPDVGALQTQVGRRVAVTGVQANRELKVSSVRLVSPSCE
jgi:hypothetical protein